MIVWCFPLQIHFRYIHACMSFLNNQNLRRKNITNSALSTLLFWKLLPRFGYMYLIFMAKATPICFFLLKHNYKFKTFSRLFGQLQIKQFKGGSSLKVTLPRHPCHEGHKLTGDEHLPISTLLPNSHTPTLWGEK